MEFRLVEQEGVVALVALDLDEAHVGRRLVERAGDGARLRGREQPVAELKEITQKRVCEPAKARGEVAAVLGREVEDNPSPG